MRTLLLALLLAVPLFAVNPTLRGQDSGNVPQKAKEEAERRGNCVEELGTTQNDGQTEILGALAPPADDSHKWWITVIFDSAIPNCPPCDKLKKDFQENEILRAWVNYQDPEKSFCHYQVRDLNDKSQVDWFKNIKPQIAKMGVPIILVQPPRNGKFGPHTTTVKLISGYNGKPEELSKKLRDSIVTYVETVNKKRHSLAVTDNGGHGQPFGPVSPISPFDPVNPSADWPPVASVMTLDQIRALVPTAPSDFLLEQLSLKVNNPSTVLSNWQLYQLKKNTPVGPIAPAPIAPAPTEPSVLPTPPTGLTWLNTTGLVLGGIMLWRNYRKANNQPVLIPDDRFQELLALVPFLKALIPTLTVSANQTNQAKTTKTQLGQ